MRTSGFPILALLGMVVLGLGALFFATPVVSIVTPPIVLPVVRPQDIGVTAEPVQRQLIQRGVALGLFSEDVSFDYVPLLREVAALGASHVALVVPLYQDHSGSTEIYLHTRFSPSLETTAEVVRAARRIGLEVTLFPIVRLAAPRSGDEWRGNLSPASVSDWFDSYGEKIGDLAALSRSTQVNRLVVGSELSSLDGPDMKQQWEKIIDRTRGLFSGPLLYSANWDHYAKAAVLDLVDEVGVTGYFELSNPLAVNKEDANVSSVVSLERRWRNIRSDLERWLGAREQRQPFIFTEIGYRSRSGSSARPWDEGTAGDVDLAEQARAFESFRRAWTGATSLSGYYVWNWYGFGGPASRGYTPRGKPAVGEVRELLRTVP